MTTVKKKQQKQLIDIVPISPSLSLQFYLSTSESNDIINWSEQKKIQNIDQKQIFSGLFVDQSHNRENIHKPAAMWSKLAFPAENLERNIQNFFSEIEFFLFLLYLFFVASPVQDISM